MINFDNVKAVTIPNGEVKKIETGGRTLWEKNNEPDPRYFINISDINNINNAIEFDRAYYDKLFKAYWNSNNVDYTDCFLAKIGTGNNATGLLICKTNKLVGMTTYNNWYASFDGGGYSALSYSSTPTTYAGGSYIVGPIPKNVLNFNNDNECLNAFFGQ